MHRWRDKPGSKTTIWFGLENFRTIPPRSNLLLGSSNSPRSAFNKSSLYYCMLAFIASVHFSISMYKSVYKCTTSCENCFIVTGSPDGLGFSWHIWIDLGQKKVRGWSEKIFYGLLPLFIKILVFLAVNAIVNWLKIGQLQVPAGVPPAKH